MRRRYIAPAARLLAVVAFSISVTSSCQGQTNDDLVSAVNAWKGRQSKITSAYFSMKCRRVFVAKSLQAPDGDERLPPKDVEAQLLLETSLSSKMWQVSMTGDIYHLNQRKLVGTHTKVAFDGKTCREFSRMSDDVPRGTVHREGYTDPLASTLCFRPVFYWGRPQVSEGSPHEALHPDKWELASSDRQVGNDNRLYLVDKGGSLGTLHLALDPDADYCPSRIQFRVGDALEWQIDIENAQDTKSRIWFPSKWKATLFRRGRLIESYEVAVNTFSVDQPIAGEVFDQPYPVGTIVSDYQTDTQFIAGDNKARIGEIPR